jgi:hypothetical protein
MKAAAAIKTTQLAALSVSPALVNSGSAPHEHGFAKTVRSKLFLQGLHALVSSQPTQSPSLSMLSQLSVHHAKHVVGRVKHVDWLQVPQHPLSAMS